MEHFRIQITPVSQQPNICLQQRIQAHTGQRQEGQLQGEQQQCGAVRVEGVYDGDKEHPALVLVRLVLVLDEPELVDDLEILLRAQLLHVQVRSIGNLRDMTNAHIGFFLQNHKLILG